MYTTTTSKEIHVQIACHRGHEPVIGRPSRQAAPSLNTRCDPVLAVCVARLVILKRYGRQLDLSAHQALQHQYQTSLTTSVVPPVGRASPTASSGSPRARR